MKIHSSRALDHIRLVPGQKFPITPAEVAIRLCKSSRRKIQPKTQQVGEVGVWGVALQPLDGEVTAEYHFPWCEGRSWPRIGFVWA